jgi:glycine/D-amino acid oxidase-like deaminating enzyme
VELPGPPEPLPSYASVTIIGGGAMGVSTAYHLAQGGVGSILVNERDLLGSGSSAKPLGGVRATFSDRVTITDLFLERDSFMDPHPFRAERFGDAEALSEVHII